MTLYVLPGMGADSTMYSGPWRDLKNTTFVDWPEYKGEKSLAELSNRVIEKYGISKDDTLAGSSMGGMVALEIAKKMGIEITFLIGSAKTRNEINPLLTLLAPLAKITPLRLSQTLSGSSSGEFGKMVMKSDSDFIKAMCIAVSKWAGPDLPDNRIVRIHGQKDKVIKCPEDCYKIAKAGHLVAITHPEDCIKVIETWAR